MIDFSVDPHDHFLRLFEEAKDKKVIEPNAISLATVDPQGQPSVRVVYYKGTIRGGLSFYTNYHGAKARDIETNPKVSANFFWAELAQQVRVEGIAVKLTRAENEAYFRTRARLSQIGAWASHQSEEIPGYEYFQNRLHEMEKRFDGVEVPCPEFWGGYRIEVTKWEFWFGHAGRLHERYVYSRAGSGSGSGWKTGMVSP